MMRIAILLLLSLITVHAQEVLLSGLIGSIRPSVQIGDVLEKSRLYRVDPQSKIQMMVAGHIAITASPQSSFSITELTDESIVIELLAGTYKVIALAADKHAMTLSIKTPLAEIKMRDTIALVKVSPNRVQTACLKAPFDIYHDRQQTRLMDHEMMSLSDNRVTKSSVDFEIFDAVYIKQSQQLPTDDQTHEERLDDPTDLEN